MSFRLQNGRTQSRETCGFRCQWRELSQAGLDVEGYVLRSQRSHKTSQLVLVFRAGNRDPRPGAGSESDGKPLSQGSESADQQVLEEH